MTTYTDLFSLAYRVYSTLGKPFSYGAEMPALTFDAVQVEKDAQAMSTWRGKDSLIAQLVESGKIKIPTVQLEDGGLHSINNGLKKLQEGHTSTKLAYAIS